MHTRGLLAAGCALFASCAQVGQITGGEKDTSPPLLVSASPPNGSVHFKSSSIRLEFNERIVLDRVRDKLLISPPLGTWPVVKVVGARTVEITLAAPLKAGTTYTFNLGECVKDLTEGNPAPGLSYVLSTGGTLDSLQLAGAVVNALTGSPEKDMLVILHNANDSGDFRAKRPDYMTRSDQAGKFTIGNLPSGDFIVQALRDKNANFRYDLPNEEVAFISDTVVLVPGDTINTTILLRAFLPPASEQQVRSIKVTPDRALQVQLSRPANNIAVRDIARTGGSLTWTPEWNITRDSVLLWPSDTTLVGEGLYQLLVGDTPIDTVRYRPTQRMPFELRVNAALREHDDTPRVRMRATRPIDRVDSAKVLLMRDSLPVAFHISRDTADMRTYVLHADIPAGTSAGLTLLPNAIRDIYGASHDTLRFPLGRAAELATGSLRVNVSGIQDSEAHFLLQLLDQQQHPIRSSPLNSTGGSTFWQHLTPGKASLRLIEDSNGNGRWDPGEWTIRQQPELTWHYDTEVTIRAAWDVVVDWKVGH